MSDNLNVRQTFWGKYPADGKPDDLRRRPDTIEMSVGEMCLAACGNILRHEYGMVQAAEINRPLDRTGQPWPLFTYPAIEYLIQFDYREKRVFEYGAGNSTLFWMERARQVVSVENNRSWYEGLKPHLKSNVDLQFEESDGFPFCIERYAEPFDVIVIDGAGYRFDCAQRARDRLAPGGLIILDNADWHHQTAAWLKRSGLLQVDMTGFKPTEHHTSTTSLFFDRAFDFQTVAARQPAFGLGAKPAHSDVWDRPYALRSTNDTKK